MKSVVRWLWIACAVLLILVLLMGFIQNPALQSFVSLVFFVLGIPLFIAAVIISGLYLILKFVKSRNSQN